LCFPERGHKIAGINPFFFDQNLTQSSQTFDRMVVKEKRSFSACSLVFFTIVVSACQNDFWEGAMLNLLSLLWGMLLGWLASYLTRIVPRGRANLCLTLLAASLAILLLAIVVTAARASTPHTITVNGTIDTAAEWDNATERLGTLGGVSYYVTWNATKLYVGFDNAGLPFKNTWSPSIQTLSIPITLAAPPGAPLLTDSPPKPSRTM
jgi:hypothetical protein